MHVENITEEVLLKIQESRIEELNDGTHQIRGFLLKKVYGCSKTRLILWIIGNKRSLVLNPSKVVKEIITSA